MAGRQSGTSGTECGLRKEDVRGLLGLYTRRFPKRPLLRIGTAEGWSGSGDSDPCALKLWRCRYPVPHGIASWAHACWSKDSCARRLKARAATVLSRRGAIRPQVQ
jgi:hypothetical protein